MTLEELAERHCDESAMFPDGRHYIFNERQLRALITEAVGIVQGDVVAWIKGNGDAVYLDKPDEVFIYEPLHHNDMTRLK